MVDPLEMLMRNDPVKTAVSRFVELPALQRSVVILKHVLDESLIEIAAPLDLTVDAVIHRLIRSDPAPDGLSPLALGGRASVKGGARFKR
jgi:hypothetical protein